MGAPSFPVISADSWTTGLEAATPLAGCGPFAAGLISLSCALGLDGDGTVSGFIGPDSFPTLSTGPPAAGTLTGGFCSLSCNLGLDGV